MRELTPARYSDPGPLLITLAAVILPIYAHAAPDTVSPDAQYSYEETSDCLDSIHTLMDVSAKAGNVAIAMLGKLPACEIEKIILAGKNDRVKQLINYRKEHKEK